MFPLIIGVVDLYISEDIGSGIMRYRALISRSRIGTVFTLWYQCRRVTSIRSFIESARLGTREARLQSTPKAWVSYTDKDFSRAILIDLIEFACTYLSINILESYYKIIFSTTKGLFIAFIQYRISCSNLAFTIKSYLQLDPHHFILYHKIMFKMTIWPFIELWKNSEFTKIKSWMNESCLSKTRMNPVSSKPSRYKGKPTDLHRINQNFLSGIFLSGPWQY